MAFLHSQNLIQNYFVKKIFFYFIKNILRNILNVFNYNKY